MRFLYVFLPICYATIVYTTLNEAPLPGFKFEKFRLTGNHSDKYPDQPPSEWTNMTFWTPGWGLPMQFTTNIDGNHSDTIPGDVPYYAVIEQEAKVFISFIWWTDNMDVWVGHP